MVFDEAFAIFAAHPFLDALLELLLLLDEVLDEGFDVLVLDLAEVFLVFIGLEHRRLNLIQTINRKH